MLQQNKKGMHTDLIPSTEIFLCFLIKSYGLQRDTFSQAFVFTIILLGISLQARPADLPLTPFTQ